VVAYRSTDPAPASSRPFPDAGLVAGRDTGLPNVQRLTVEQVTLSGISPGQNTIGIAAIRSGLIDSQELSEVVLRARAITTIRHGATWKITRLGTWTGTRLYGWPAP
jgi:hypothetical protein